jgi:hypothetical protein
MPTRKLASIAFAAFLIAPAMAMAAGGAAAQKDPFKDQESPKEVLRAIERAFEKRDPATLDRFGASSGSLDILEAYGAETLAKVQAAVLSNAKVMSPSSDASPSGGSTQPDEPLRYKGFNVEVSGAADDSSEDNAWKPCNGGGLNLHESDAVVGRDDAGHFVPGKGYVTNLSLEGFMTPTRRALKDWIKDEGSVDAPPLNVTLTAASEGTAAGGEPSTSSETVGALEAHWFKDELLLVVLHPDALTLRLLTLEATDGNGKACPAPPRLLHAGPSSGPAFIPIAIGGSNFAEGTVPHVSGTPSISIFNWQIQNIPLIGSISVGFTIVPPAAPSGAGDVTVEYLGQRSNAFPFTVNGVSPPGGSNNSTTFVTQMSFTFAVTTNGSTRASEASGTLNCALDWGNTTMPPPNKDVVHGTEATLRTRRLATTISMDSEKPSLPEWLLTWDSDKGVPRDFEVSAEGKGTEAQRNWSFYDCFPIKYDPGDYSPSSTTKVETITVKIGHVEFA